MMPYTQPQRPLPPRRRHSVCAQHKPPAPTTPTHNLPPHSSCAHTHLVSLMLGATSGPGPMARSKRGSTPCRAPPRQNKVFLTAEASAVARPTTDAGGAVGPVERAAARVVAVAPFVGASVVRVGNGGEPCRATDRRATLRRPVLGAERGRDSGVETGGGGFRKWAVDPPMNSTALQQQHG